MSPASLDSIARVPHSLLFVSDTREVRDVADETPACGVQQFRICLPEIRGVRPVHIHETFVVGGIGEIRGEPECCSVRPVAAVEVGGSGIRLTQMARALRVRRRSSTTSVGRGMLRRLAIRG